MQKLEKKVSAVLVAAGSSTRMGFDKLSFDLGGETVVQRSIRAFAECPLVSEIVLVAGKNRAFLEQQAGACTKPVQVVQGGATRAESAKNGVLAAHGELVAVHDAARPFVSQAVITAALEAAAACGAAAPAVPVKDTVKRAVRGDGKTVPEQCMVADTPDRSTLYAVQTPQCFDRAAYLAALDELDVEKAKTIVGCAKHQQWAEECADKAITLVKEQPGVLPITPERYKKILFYTIEPAAGGEGNYKVAPACAKLRAMLEKEGFEIDDFVPQPYGEGFTTKYEEVVNNYDLILYVANLSTKSNQTVVRIEWKQPMGADCGHYMNDIPTVFVSLENPYHLQDFPRVKTYINCYSNNDHCLHQLIEKLTGRSTFKGNSPVDAFCGKWDAHL